MVRIRDNQTGQVMNVNSSELGNYGLGAPSNSTMNNGGGLASSIGGFLGNILSPLAKSGRTIGEGVSEGLQSLQYILGNKNAFQNNTLPDSFRLNPQEVGQIRENPLGEAAKQSAGLASFAVPFGRGENFLSKVLFPGAAVGGLQSASEGNDTQTNVGNSVLGGILAGATHGILKTPSLLGKTGDVVKGMGSGLRSNVSKIEVAPSIFGAAREKQINNTLDQLGIKGNASQKYAQLGPAYTRLGDQIQSSLAQNPKEVPINNVINDLTANLNDNKTLDLSGEKAKSAVNQFIKSIYPGTASEVVPQKIGTDELFKLKQQINQGYGTISNKLRNGQPLSDYEKVIYTARKTLDDIISENHPEVKALTVRQSHLYDAAESLANSRNSDASIQVMGTKIPSRFVQASADTAGNALQKGGESIQNIAGSSDFVSNPLIRQILLQGASRSSALVGGNGIQNEATNGQDNGSYSNNPNDLQHIPNYTQPAQANTSGGYTLTPEMVSMAYLMLPSKQADKLKAAYDAQVGTLQERQKKISLQRASSIIDQLESTYNKNGLAGGRVGGKLNQILAAGGLNSNVRTYEAARESVRPLLAKAFGDVGNLSIQEQENAVKLLPTAQDTPQEARQKFAQLKSILAQ